MRIKETEGSLRRYLLRGMAVGLVLWLPLLAACRSQNPHPTGNCPPPVTQTGQALSATDNTIYKFNAPLPCTTRFWRAATIVTAIVSETGGPIQPGQQSTLNQDITTQIQNILNNNKSLPKDQSMKMVTATPLEGAAGGSSSDLLGSTLALFLTLQIQFRDGSTKRMGDNNLVKAVNTINNSPTVLNKMPIKSGSGPAVFISSASPDWLSGGGQGGFTGGHPDGDPTGSGTTWSTNCASGLGPVVYVLDTAHPLSVDATGKPVHLDKTIPLSRPIPTIPPNVVPRPSVATSTCDFSHDVGASTRETDVALDDADEYGLEIFNPYSKNSNELREHGLFVSDIIHHIAPLASIRLIRVLNDYAVGDLNALIYGLQLIYDEQIRDQIRGAIVNMSLGVVPPPKCLQSIWNNLPNWENQYGGTQNHPQADINACSGQVAAITNDHNLTQLYVPLGLMINELATVGDHLVAAAGNDSTAFGAELPAAFCNVIAVGWTPVPASNNWHYTSSTTLYPQSNVPYFDGTNCLSVDLANGRLMEQPGQPDHAVVALGSGICSLLLHGKRDLPGGTQGLAIWKGTSFSTAIISGNLALHGGTLPGGSVLDESQPC